MNTNHSHEKDVIGHLVGVGLAWAASFGMAGLLILYAYDHQQPKKETGLVPSNCPSTLVTITVYIDNKQYSWQQRDTARSFDFELPHKIRVEVKPPKEYY